VSSLISFIVSGFTGLATLIESAVIAVCNLVLAAVGAVVTGLFALLPALPSVPSIPDSPPVLAWLNWLVPVDAFLGILLTVVLMYVAYLAWRWLLNFLRAL
jgi:hypothetical protein